MSIWKQGDTQPPMIIDCFDGAGRPADLTGTSVLKVKVSRRGEPVWERDVVGTAEGVVTVDLTPADTAIPGTYFVKVFAQWPNGARQHYPPGDRYMTMTVTR